MDRTTKDFWLLRISEALDSAATAPSERSQRAYVELARHYCSMHSRVNGGSAPRPVMQMASEAAVIAAHNFGSVHDALMQAA